MNIPFDMRTRLQRDCLAAYRTVNAPLDDDIFRNYTAGDHRLFAQYQRDAPNVALDFPVNLQFALRNDGPFDR